MFMKLFNPCHNHSGGGSQPVCCEAVYIKSSMQLKILDMCTHRIKTEIGGFDEVLAILSGTIKYL